MDATFQRLFDKCRVCEDGGCWEWAAGFNGAGIPIFHFPGTRQARRSMLAYKAAYILSGRTVPDGYCVYRKHCLNFKCVNPDHCGVGTRKMIGAYIAKVGFFKNRPARIAANAKNRKAQRTSEPVVRQIEALLADGVRRIDIAERLNVGKGVVTDVKRGRHFHCSARPKVLRGASVFAF